MPASLFSAQETSRVAPQVLPGLRELVDLPASRGLLVLLGLTASRGPRGLKVTKVLRDLLDVKATKDLKDLRVLVVSRVLNTLHGQVKPVAEGLEKLLSKLAKYELSRIPASFPISTIFKRIQRSYSTLVGRTPSNGEEGEEILVIERFLHLRHILRRFLAGRISNIQTILQLRCQRITV